MKRNLIAVAILLAFAAGCTTYRKIGALKKNVPGSLISLSDKSDIPELKYAEIARDTLSVTDDDGKEILILKAVRDENGEMVANDVIKAAKVTARFRNIAERHGMVDICFDINVPKEMQDSKWQARFYPELTVLNERIGLDPVIITGRQYRKQQLKGYEQYRKFLASISSDSTKFIDERQLEIFLRRNIPQIYRYRSDSSFVSDTEFTSAYGVTEKIALEHYTNRFIVNRNRHKIGIKKKMHDKFIKVSILSEGLRLDTVMLNSDNEFVYSYVQTISARPKLRRADVRLFGSIYEQDKQIYKIPKSEPITFYISSLSALVDNREKYMTKVIERRAAANNICYIDFEAADYNVNPEFGNNASEIGRIKESLRTLVQNEVFDIDSIIVTASCSPEGSYSYNAMLSKKRSEAVCNYFEMFIRNYSDSLKTVQGRILDYAGEFNSLNKPAKIRFIARNNPENWSMLENLVERDTVISNSQRAAFFTPEAASDPDDREAMLKNEPYYNYLRTKIYPKLRTVRFDTYLHRRNMIKDTVHTTVLDTTYMNGVQAIRDRDYKQAVSLLRPYNDFNTAVAYCSMDYNASAMSILEKLEKTDKVDYMLAILFSRQGDYGKAVKHYMSACNKNRDFVSRGNLDPEISALIRKYRLNSEDLP